MGSTCGVLTAPPAGKNPQFITKVALCLKLEVYAPADVIVSSGEAGERCGEGEDGLHDTIIM
eukprot:4391388-Pyramimonas_sp.AAC.2